ncbi:ribonuclease HII [Perkinsela sp. CCAP 1560/4]|nr:ribonuclease HII [Perkinsela sp. CCAP 1560/4]|eukprot:KNH09752.1 ribonuclease HII [Perkinsela sp. CCAP 1560/4]
MSRLRPSGLSISKDFELLKKVPTREIRAYRWEAKDITQTVAKIRYIIGIDEVANGSLAGPMVVAGCCILKGFTPDKILETVYDCKKFQNKPKTLSLVNHALESEPHIVYDRVFMNSSEIDKQKNIYKSKLACWVKCIRNLTYKLYATQLRGLAATDVYDKRVIKEKGIIMEFSDFLESVAVVADGQEVPKIGHEKIYPTHMYSIPKADTMFYTVAASSILAKHSADELMTGEYHKKYVEYNFKKNKGYGTLQHREILRQIGPCPIHRRTFITNIWNSVLNKA